VDLNLLTAEMQRESSRHGISPEEGGHHAGEIETSILLALDPGAVRRDAFEAGFVETVEDAQALFYPSLRQRVPRGTVGDPRRADAARGSRYLEAWVGILAAAYRGEKNDP
jgi:creatinine amidohydrolase